MNPTLLGDTVMVVVMFMLVVGMALLVAFRMGMNKGAMAVGEMIGLGELDDMIIDARMADVFGRAILEGYLDHLVDERVRNREQENG